MAHRIGGAVELAVLIVAPADDRLDRALSCHRHDCCLCRVILRAFGIKLLVDDALCRLLQLRIDRRLHLDHEIAGNMLGLDKCERVGIGLIEEPVGACDGG